VQLSLEFTVSSKLDKDYFVEEEPDEVERLRHMMGFFTGVSHGYVDRCC
jgi:hypothetical protein